MFQHGKTLLGAALVAAALLSPGLAAARPCSVIDSEARAIRQVQSQDDLDRLIELYKEAHDEAAGCDETYLAIFGDDVARAHVDMFWAEYEKDQDAAAHKHILEAGKQFGQPWQLLLQLAEVDYEIGASDTAAVYYQQAVTAMQTTDRAVGDTVAKDSLPNVEEFKGIYARMAQSALLAEDFSPPPASRGVGEDGGLFIPEYRGFKVESVPVPIEFQFASIRFTLKGEKAAAHLLEHLKGAKVATVKLVGHTDPVGSDAANARLSLRRAEAVRRYLVENGYEGEIIVDGKGESQPFEPVPEKLEGDENAVNQLHRRVELVRLEG